MDGRLNIRRIAIAVFLGLSLGGIFCILLTAYIEYHQPIAVAITQTTIASIDNSSVPMRPVATIDTPESSSIRIRFAGDMMFDRNVHARSGKNLAYPFAHLPADWFESPDYSVANLEGVVTDKRRAPEKTIDFQFDPAIVPVLKAQGLDALSQANNHSLDQGFLGYQDSVNRLRAAGFLVFGHQVHDDIGALATTTIRGTRFAFLGFNTTDNTLDRVEASSTIAIAKQQAEKTIVFMHWGQEYRNTPPPDVIDNAHWLIDHGVDIVIGGHPHWTQGISEYKGKPIVWSLGNFIFDQEFSEEVQNGLSIDLVYSPELSIELHPVRIDVSQPRVLEGEEKQKRLDYLAGISDSSLAGQIKAGMIHF